MRVSGSWFQIGSEVKLRFLMENQEDKVLKLLFERNSVGLILSVLQKFTATKPFLQRSLVLCLSLTD